MVHVLRWSRPDSWRTHAPPPESPALFPVKLTSCRFTRLALLTAAPPPHPLALFPSKLTFRSASGAWAVSKSRPPPSSRSAELFRNTLSSISASPFCSTAIPPPPPTPVATLPSRTHRCILSSAAAHHGSPSHQGNAPPPSKKTPEAYCARQRRKVVSRKKPAEW